MRYLLVLAVLVSGCAQSSPLAPAQPPLATPLPTPMPHVWALSGQSNAAGLLPALATYKTIIGAQLGAQPITAWAPDAPLWLELERSLQQKVEVDAFIWWQGEAGIYGDQRDIDAYPAQLDDLIARVSAIHVPAKIVICGLNSQPGFQFFRAMQIRYAAERGYVFVPSHDLPAQDEGWWSPHLTQDGYRLMAERVAEALR